MNVFPGLSAFCSAFWILQFACPLFDVLVEVIRDGYVSVSDEIMKLGKKEEL